MTQLEHVADVGMPLSGLPQAPHDVSVAEEREVETPKARRRLQWSHMRGCFVRSARGGQGQRDAARMYR